MSGGVAHWCKVPEVPSRACFDPEASSCWHTCGDNCVSTYALWLGFPNVDTARRCMSVCHIRLFTCVYDAHMARKNRGSEAAKRTAEYHLQVQGSIRGGLFGISISAQLLAVHAYALFLTVAHS